ncbi:MAG TPA: PadR family transcriptional regulator [Candidatus Saccharimonadia bacterium]
MNPPALTFNELWVLMALGYEPCHAYGLSAKITHATLQGFAPTPSRVRRALGSLAKRGYVQEVWRENSLKTGHPRIMYHVTKRGWQCLEAERHAWARVAREVDLAVLRHAQLDEQVIELQGLVGLRLG